jgi:hypothetical protein
MMNNFNPSNDFVTRTMDDIRSYEIVSRHRKEQMNAFLLSKPAFYLLSAAGALFGIINLIGMAWTLISPAICL